MAADEGGPLSGLFSKVKDFLGFHVTKPSHTQLRAVAYARCGILSDGWQIVTRGGGSIFIVCCNGICSAHVIMCGAIVVDIMTNTTYKIK